MEKTKLTKREYLGTGTFCEFLNKETQETYLQEIDKELYTLICGVDGYKYNPEPKEGFTLVTISSDVIKVDSEKGILVTNEYVIDNNGTYVVSFEEDGLAKQRSYTEEQFNNIWQ